MFEIDLKVDGRTVDRVLVQNEGERYRVMAEGAHGFVDNGDQSVRELALEALQCVTATQ